VRSRGRGTIKPATAHQEFRILSHILNGAVKQKRLAVNPCVGAEFPVSVTKSTRKPHAMTATEQAKIESVAPGYVRNIVVIVSELGLRYKVWAAMLNRAGVPYLCPTNFGARTAATRLSAGEVADHMVLQMFRQEDAEVVLRS
jgi:hypothetical protein